MWEMIQRAALGARHSGLVRYLDRVFGNEATVGRDSGGDLRGNAAEKRRIRAEWRVAAAATGPGGPALDGQNQARHEAGLVGQATSMM